MTKIFLAVALGFLLCLNGDSKITDGSLIQNSVLASKTYPGGFQIYITTPSAMPIPAQTPFVLQANVTMESGTGSFDFKWLLPPGVQVVNGEVKSALTFAANGSAQTQITLILKVAGVNYQISAEAKRRVGDSVQGSVAQFNTNPGALLSPHLLFDKHKHRLIH